MNRIAFKCGVLVSLKYQKKSADYANVYTTVSYHYLAHSTISPYRTRIIISLEFYTKTKNQKILEHASGKLVNISLVEV